MPGQEAAHGLDGFLSFDGQPGSCTDDWTVTEAFSSMVHDCSGVFFFPFPAHRCDQNQFFLPGFVETSQSDLKLYLETEKNSMTKNQTKSLLFFKSSEYVKLYEKLLFIFFKVCGTWEYLHLNVFCYSVCWCCLLGFVFKHQ